MNNIPRIGSMIWEGNYSVEGDIDYRYGKRLKYFEYNWENPEDEKIVVFSDYKIPSAGLPRFSKVLYKIAWMIEGPEVYEVYGGHRANKEWLLAHLDIFTKVATCDDSLVRKYPNKMVFVPFGGILVPPELTRIYEKTKMCSMTAGVLYGERYTVIEKYRNCNKIDFLGRAFGKPYASTEEGFKDYMYHITIPSSRANRYFSSNLTDAFACGTVPIWWGCSKIGDFFDTDGMILVNSRDELHQAIEMMCAEDYNNRKDAILTNHKLVERYRTSENVLWENLLSQLYETISD